MIKMNKVGQEAIYTAPPYFDRIDLTEAYIKSIKWQDDQGIMIVEKSRQPYKILLSQKTYLGSDSLQKLLKGKAHQFVKKVTATLSPVKTSHFNLGTVYNLRQIDF